MDELSPRFEPQRIEKELYTRWVERGYFHADSGSVLAGRREPYVIVIPPPNVTDVLHMGHGLNNTIQDVLIRWRRMQGCESLWVPGTDHAGIATQNVVERRLAERGLTRFDLGREAFVDEVWRFVRETGGTILEQLKAIGCSCDWGRTRFTLDPGLSRAVREVFVRLYEKGLVYRGEYIINWCPRCLTALSNEEAESEEVDGRLYRLLYPLSGEAQEAAARAAADGAVAVVRLADGRWALTVATTRPETMLGDTAVAVHPQDTRHRTLVGRSVELPLAGRTIPIIADEAVDPSFGSGMVKVTPAHDANDFEMARRHDLPFVDIFTAEARTNDSVPERFRGLDRLDARQAVLAALRDGGLVVGEEPHRHAVPHCYRCGTIVEPRISEQWFVRMKPLAEPALRASRDGIITFTPERWKRVYENWLENIRDLCIYRQLWWGHRIPVWYCRAGGCSQEPIVAREDPTACPRCGAAEIEQDSDVLDTWFSSWLWPFSVFGWPEETEDRKAFYPTHTLSTAPEILFFWVARMIMAGYEFLGREPFTEVYIHGTVRDTLGRKMSKSLGNGIDPLEVVDRFGADALRFTVLSAAAVGTDIYLDPNDLEASFVSGRNFANKVWNAGRFTLMNVGAEPVRPLRQVADSLELADRWILSRLSRTSREMTAHLEGFRLHEVAGAAYRFFWGEFADWYLELVKPRLKGEAGEALDVSARSREAARTTLVTVLDGICRLLHPLIPFVTEALWLRLPWREGEERPESLVTAPWPEPVPALEDEEAEARMAAVQELIGTVRSLRKEYGVKEGQRVRVQVSGASPELKATLGAEARALERLAWIDAVSFDGAGGGAGAHAVLPGGVELFIPLEGVIDLDRERERLRGEIVRLEEQLARSEAQLANPEFVARAPVEVVEREREKAKGAREQRHKLLEKLATLEAT
ncbi:MAG: valine--tRNA ligase [Gemmatimonadetes bacterium]|nr:valine--tRNA ligase [Gemmatimonadota bacterium]